MPDAQPRTKGEVVFEGAQNDLAAAIDKLKMVRLALAIVGVDTALRVRLVGLIHEAESLAVEVKLP